MLGISDNKINLGSSYLRAVVGLDLCERSSYFSITWILFPFSVSFDLPRGSLPRQRLKRLSHGFTPLLSLSP